MDAFVWYFDRALDDAKEWLNEIPDKGIHVTKTRTVEWSHHDFGVRIVLNSSYHNSVKHLYKSSNRLKSLKEDSTEDDKSANQNQSEQSNDQE